MKLTKAQRACLQWYKERANSPVRLQRPPYEFGTRQVNSALLRGWLETGPDGWHAITDAGRKALEDGDG